MVAKIKTRITYCGIILVILFLVVGFFYSKTTDALPPEIESRLHDSEIKLPVVSLKTINKKRISAYRLWLYPAFGGEVICVTVFRNKAMDGGHLHFRRTSERENTDFSAKLNLKTIDNLEQLLSKESFWSLPAYDNEAGLADGDSTAIEAIDDLHGHKIAYQHQQQRGETAIRKIADFLLRLPSGPGAPTVFQNYLLLNNDIKRGTTISKECLQSVEVLYGHYPNDCILDERLAIGRIANKDLWAYHVLFNKDLDK